jgi:hypothetical protein
MTLDEPSISLRFDRIRQIICDAQTSSGKAAVCPHTILEIASALDLDLQLLPCCVALIVHRIREYIIKASIEHQNEEAVGALYSDLSQVLEKSVELPSFDIAPCDEFSKGTKKCVHCTSRPAIALCGSCVDHFCSDCFRSLHAKGNRLEHNVYWLDLCSTCNCSIATIQSSVADSKLCEECFANQHSSGLPPDLFEPRKLEIPKFSDLIMLKDTRKPSEEWIPFYDEHGLCYFFNFKTTESFRRKPVQATRENPATNSVREPFIPDEESDVAERMKQYKTSL